MSKPNTPANDGQKPSARASSAFFRSVEAIRNFVCERDKDLGHFYEFYKRRCEIADLFCHLIDEASETKDKFYRDARLRLVKFLIRASIETLALDSTSLGASYDELQVLCRNFLDKYSQITFEPKELEEWEKEA